MMSRRRWLTTVYAVLISLFALSIARATTWSTQDYDLYFGDFDGDGKMDVLYIAKSANNASGIDLSDGSGPNIPLQSWPSNYLGIPWYGNHFTVIVGDFNGDGHADILLQDNSPGDSYILLSNQQGMITAVSQAIPSVVGGVGWSADQHHLVAGDFNGDGRTDLFLQSTSTLGVNAVFLAESNGQFAASDLSQQWQDGYLGLYWATTEALIYAGDFNGDHRSDLLVQARPRTTIIRYAVPFPVASFAPNTNGVVLSSASGSLFQATGVQAWSTNAFGVDWSPLVSNLVVGYFNSTQDADVLLQGETTSVSSELVSGNSSGAIFSSDTSLSSNVAWSGGTYRLIAANLSGALPEGVYLQATSASGTNYYVTGLTGSTANVTPETPVISNALTTYGYDPLGRLVSTNHSGTVNNGVQTTYNYDAAGNRTTTAVSGASH